MKSKGNNNKPVLKVVTTKTLQPPKRHHTADVCLPVVTQGHFAKSWNLAFLVLICKKCKILRFHDLIAKIGIAKIGIAKIGIAKIGIPILAIHPDWDPDFSNPS
jgi:hypothetical protein